MHTVLAPATVCIAFVAWPYPRAKAGQAFSKVEECPASKITTIYQPPKKAMTLNHILSLVHFLLVMRLIS